FVERQMGWGRKAGLCRGLRRGGVNFHGLVRIRPMHDPDVVLGVHSHTNGHAQDPMVRKRLWPQRVHFKLRRLDAGGGDGSAPLEDEGADAEPCETSEQGCYLDNTRL